VDPADHRVRGHVRPGDSGSRVGGDQPLRGRRADHAIADFALAYADQNERDYQQLRKAISDAPIQATVEQ
jgi:hypothetical protein